MSLTITDRIALAQKAHAEGRIIQHDWNRTDERGRHLVCALAAFGDGDIDSASKCPAELMPSWVAHLVPRLDDGIAADQVSWFFGNLLDRVQRWHALDEAAWDRIRTGFMIFAIEDAVKRAESVQPDPRPAYWQKVAGACAGVVTALKSGEGLAEARKAARWAAAAAEAAAYRRLAETLFQLIDAELDA